MPATKINVFVAGDTFMIWQMFPSRFQRTMLLPVTCPDDEDSSSVRKVGAYLPDRTVVQGWRHLTAFTAMIKVLWRHRVSSHTFFFFFQALNFLVESFGLLNDLFHFHRSWTQVIQFLIFIWQMSGLMLSSHLYSGLPWDLLVRGFQLNIFLTVLVSGILCTWLNQLSLWALT